MAVVSFLLETKYRFVIHLPIIICHQPEGYGYKHEWKIMAYDFGK